MFYVSHHMSSKIIWQKISGAGYVLYKYLVKILFIIKLVYAFDRKVEGYGDKPFS